MKVLTINSAKSIALVPQNFLNPRGASLKLMAAALKERYNFSVSPLEKPVTEKDGAQFQAGEFSPPNRSAISLNLTVHTDGIVVETRSSTEDADLFLEDAFAWAHKEFGLPTLRDLPIKKIYSNDLFVRFEKTPIFYNEKLIGLLGTISALVGDEKTGQFDFLGLNLGTDPAKSERPKLFRFEREAGTAFNENRFYSFAQARTEPHLKLLEILENL